MAIPVESRRFAVILAGGRGERFWPKSRLRRPKQFLPIVGDSPLLVQTISRLNGIVPPEQILILTNQEHRAIAVEMCPGIPAENIIGEPVGRDTAPAAALANLLVERRCPGAAYAMLPADHVVRDTKAFQATLTAAFNAAETSDVLVTIGIPATYPATGYGYIQKGLPLGNHFTDHQPYAVDRFVEKPDSKSAESYVASGNYFWNAGMFVWRTEVFRKELGQHATDLAGGMLEIADRLNAGTALSEVLSAKYGSLRRISIDYAILERAESVVVIPATFDWDDVGEWPAIARHFPTDEHANVLGDGAIVEGGTNNIILGSHDRLTAVLGADDLIVVQTDDATLVCHKSRAQELKRLVSRLSSEPDLRRFL